MVHRGRVLPQARGECPHELRVAAPGLPYVESDRLRRGDAEPLLQQVEHAADAPVQIQGIRGGDAGRRQDASHGCQLTVCEVSRRLAEQDAESRPRAQALPVAVWECAQLGVALEHQAGPVRRAELGEPLAVCARAIDQMWIVYARD